MSAGEAPSAAVSENPDTDLHDEHQGEKPLQDVGQ